MKKSTLFAAVGFAALLGFATPLLALPVSAAPELQRGREWRDAERAQREAERAQREAERAQREAEREWREARRDWREAVQARWDTTPNWIERVVQVPAVAPQPVTVQVLLPPSSVGAWPAPTFTSTVQAQVLPALVQVLPAEVLPQAPLQFWLVQPNVFVVAHPALFWGPDDFWAAQQFAAQLPTPGFQPLLFNGPFGQGVYLVYQLG